MYWSVFNAICRISAAALSGWDAVSNSSRVDIGDSILPGQTEKIWQFKGINGAVILVYAFRRDFEREYIGVGP